MTQATAALPYCREDVQRSFDPLSFHRGLRYLREERVQDGAVEVDARGTLILRGRVEGTEVYALEVRVQLDGHQPRISSACDCPVQVNCKHGVALALHLLNNAREAEHDPGQLARNQLLHWLDETAKATEARHMGGARDELHYLLHGGALDEDARYAVDAAIKVVRTRPRKTGQGYVKPQPVSPGELTNLRARGVMSGEDLEALGLLVLASQSLGPLHAALDAQLGERILRAAAATGRLHWKELDGPLLEWAEARPLRAEWQRAGGDYRLQLDTDPRATLLHGPLPLFVDAKAGGCGLLKEYPELNGTQWAQLRSMPAVPEALAAEFGQKLRLKLPQLPLPSPLPLEERHLRDARPEPVLRLRASAGPEGTKRTLDLQFRYGHLSINPRRPDPILAQADGDHLVFVHRALDSEREATEKLMALGWRAQASDAEAHRFTPAADTPSAALQIWHRLLEEERPALEAAGWRFIEEAGLGLRFIDADWDAALDEGPDWFDLRFDLDIDGTRVALAPLLAPLVGEWLAVPENLWPDRLAVDLGDGRQVLLDSRRLQPIMRTLDELFQLSGMDGGEALRLPRARAGLLAALDQSRALRGAAELRSMLKGLRDPGVIEAVE
ncbi:MAG: SWIM zinc finger family protein, partial [Oceanococcaceae bacterium]